jgi:excinuclease ABC subunit C
MFDYKRKLEEIPKNPGIYQFINKDGAVIYVGKAKNLKSRVAQYFSGHDNRPQLPYLIAEATDINYTVVTNELEAAFLENTLIKQYSPKYNIDLKDDKNYAFITIDYATEIPQIGYARKIETSRRHSEPQPSKPSGGEESQKRDPSAALRMTPMCKYFGPYSAVHKIRNTLNLVRRVFPYCANEKVSARPCFYYYMHRCPGVCIGKISIEEYKIQMDRICEFLSGNNQKIVADIKKDMAVASKNKKFEKAARLRDSLRALEILQEKQNVIMPKKVNWDLVSIAESDGYACINLFKVREGKLYDKENFVYEIPDSYRGHSESLPSDSSGDEESQPQTGILRTDAITQNDAKREVIERFLEQYYLETSSRPSSIYLQFTSDNSNLIKTIIRSRFNRGVDIIVPQRGKPFGLIGLGQTNAEEFLRNWLKDKAGNLDKINTALNGLKDILNLPQIPKRIECYDNSNMQGTNPVGSMVVFENGLPAKSQYRKFKFAVKKNPPAGGDDFGMMKEMLTRRLARSADSPPTKGESRAERGERVGAAIKKTPTTPSASRPPLLKKEGNSAWPLPDLIIIDGGKGQLSAAMEALNSNSLPLNSIPIIGLAKRIEEIFLPSNPTPIILDHRHPSLQLLQRLRDEAHRFGITFHRALRSKQAVKSALDTIPGVGPKTKKLLKTKFGTVAEIKQRSTDELAAVVGKKLAEEIKKHL